MRELLVDTKLVPYLLREDGKFSFKVIEGLPTGSNIVESFLDANDGVLVLLIHHESFEELADGRLVPPIIVTLASGDVPELSIAAKVYKENFKV